MEKFRFSNGQDLAALDSTGVISTNIWDIEENAVTDGQVFGWLHFLILATTNTGGTEGLDIELRTSDAAAMTTTPLYLGCLKLTQAEIAANKHFAVGVLKSALKKYVSPWYKAVSTALNNATTVDCWFEDGPGEAIVRQKKNTSTGA